MSIEPPPTRTEPRSWRPSEQIDLAIDAEVSAWAARLCLTPGELREIIEEMGDRTTPIGAEAGVSMEALGEQDGHGMLRAGLSE